jgi:ESF2/ABP1 family protein
MPLEISKQTKEDKNFVRNVEKPKIMKTRQAMAVLKEYASSTVAIPARKWTLDQIPLAKSEQEKQPEHVRRALKMVLLRPLPQVALGT